MHDAGQPGQGWVAAQVEGVHQDLEGALAVAVGELRAWGVKEACLLGLGHGGDVVGGDVQGT